MTFSSELVALTEGHLQLIDARPSLQAMLEGRLSKSDYAQFLVRLYPLVSNFCPIMAAAAGHCADRAPGLRGFLYEHVQEERGHEQMVLNDLQALGWSTEQVPTMRPTAAVQAILSFNYHGIAYEHPACVLGLVYVLELMSSLYGGKVATAISNKLDLPLSSGFTFLESHASLDEDHMAALRLLLQHPDCLGASDSILNSVDVNFQLFALVLGHPGTARLRTRHAIEPEVTIQFARHGMS